MEAGHFIEVINPYNWLPGYGENSVQISMQGMNMTVLITYDSEDGEQQQKEIIFKNVSSFYHGSFPGPNMLRIIYNSEDKENMPLGTLVEFPESEAARAWTEHHQGIWSVKHYKWIFLSENIMLEIFAEMVQIEDHLF